MALSVTEPIDRAFKHTGRVLFKPFRIGKWFTLGFCAWLAYLGEWGGRFYGCNLILPSGGGGGGPGPVITPGPGPATPPTAPFPPAGAGSPTAPPRTAASDPFQFVFDWFSDHAVLVITAGILFFLLIIAIWLVVLWISSRAKFVFLDGVVHNRGAVAQPWKDFRRLGNSLFGFRLCLLLIGMGTLLLICAVSALISLGDILAQQFDTGAIAAIVVGGLLSIVYVFIFLFIGLWLEDFVVPIMYQRDMLTLAACKLFWHEILTGNVGTIILFYLMKFVLAIAIGVLACVATCLTCFLAALPYLGSVILLPLIVFGRSYSLFMLQQFGSAWRIFPGDVCPMCGYDLRGSVGRPMCPECGAMIAAPPATPPPMASPPTS